MLIYSYPTFSPQKFLSIMACNGHCNFISGVTDAVWQSGLGFVRGVGLKEPGLRLTDRGRRMDFQIWQSTKSLLLSDFYLYCLGSSYIVNRKTLFYASKGYVCQVSYIAFPCRDIRPVEF